MLEIMQRVIEGALGHLGHYATTYLPSLLAALTLVLGAYIFAVLARWLLYKIFKGLTIDRFLRQSGVAFMIDRSGRLRATRIVAESMYWGILLSGVLVGLSVFNTNLTSNMIENFVFLLPKLLIAGAILLAGAWLGQYLGRSALVWAVNENFPWARSMAVTVRVLIMFVAVVVAADQLNFARGVFLAAFIIIVGGAALAASLAIGLGVGRSVVQRHMEERRERVADSSERSLWSHL